MKVKQNTVLFELLKSNPDNGVSKQVIAETLGVKESSVPVYIHALKKEFKKQFKHHADIVTVRVGKKAANYKLVNADGVNLSSDASKSKKAVKSKPVVDSDSNNVVTVSETGELPIIDKDNDIVSISDREFADLRDSLGVNSFNKDYF